LRHWCGWKADAACGELSSTDTRYLGFTDSTILGASGALYRVSIVSIATTHASLEFRVDSFPGSAVLSRFDYEHRWTGYEHDDEKPAHLCRLSSNSTCGYVEDDHRGIPCRIAMAI
jgi:hypothetical protein